MTTPLASISDDRVHLGVSWYPECWEPEDWKADVAKMSEVNISLVRLFEFAWKRFEPSEGNFDFDWALQVLDHLHAAGIQAMIGTPTAAPPAWLTTAHPEVLKTNAKGHTATHGKRKHYNHHSKLYREYAHKIVAKMVEEFGDHPAVHSWQIDNEMSGFDYSPETVKAFHQWLQSRYGTIENLNRTWGLNFWSQAYDSFDQVPLCTAELGSREAPERHHPSLIVSIARFQNDAWTSFIGAQAEVIRSKCSHPVTTNMTGAVGPMDWPQHFRLLDRSGASMYADRAFYQNNLLRFDRLRAEKPSPYWLLETAPNWSGGGPVWNIHHDKYGVRLFSWLSVLLGGSMVLYWQWRSHWAGQEMQHGTIVSATGSWMPNKETWKQLGQEFKEQSEFLLANPAQTAPIGVVTSSTSVWCFAIDPIDPAKNKYLDNLLNHVHLPLVYANWYRDVIDMQADFTPYKVLVLPRLPMLTEDAISRLKVWVEQGGVAIVGPMTGYRTEEMTARKDKVLGNLADLVGSDCSVRFSPHWVEEKIDVEFVDGSSCHPAVWCDGYPADGSLKVLAKYRGGYGDGHAAVVEHSVGKGKVIAVGCPLEDDSWLKLVGGIFADAGIERLVDPTEENNRVILCPRGESGMGVANLVDAERSVVLKGRWKDRLTGEPLQDNIPLQPFQVRLLEKEEV